MTRGFFTHCMVRPILFLLPMSLLVAVIPAHFAPHTARAASAPEVEWEEKFGGIYDDNPFSGRQTSDGGYVLVGYTHSLGATGTDAWLIKTDASGDKQWERTFGGPDDAEWGRSVQQTSDGGYVLAGPRGGFSGWEDAWLIKTDASGDKQWERTFGGSHYCPNYMQQTSDGGYVLAGWTSSSAAAKDQDGWLMKTDASGNKQWEKTFGGPDQDVFGSVQQTSDGGYVLEGCTACFTGGYAWLIKTDASGNKQWDRTFGGPGQDTVGSVQQTSDGGYVLAGSTSSSGWQESDGWLMKTDASGNRLWEKTFGGTGFQAACSVQQTSDGGYVLAGETRSYGLNAWLIKTDASGDKLWDSTFGGSDYRSAAFVQQTSDGGYMLGGQSSSGGRQDAWLIKLAPDAGPVPNRAPDRPVNISPADGDQAVSLMPTLQGSVFSDPDGDTRAASQWQIRSSTGDYNSPVWDSGSSAADPSITVPTGKLGNGTACYWRVRYQDSRGAWSEWSAETSFTTVMTPGSPSVTTSVATSITQTSATLNGNLTSLGSASSVEVSFEWGLTTAYGTPLPVKAMNAPGAFSATVSGLTPGATYHFRAKAVAGDTTVYGDPEITFTTGGDSDTSPPTVNDFTADKTSVATGEKIRLSYSVSDSGGSGLKQVELWQGTDSDGDGQPNWPDSSTGYVEMRPLSGQEATGSFDVTLTSGGTFWYGIHVLDNAGNMNDEANSATDGRPGVFGPVSLTVSGGVDNNQRPTADFAWSPQEPKAGEWVILDASGSSDSDGHIELFEWDWHNNGTTNDALADPKVTYYWDKAGTYTVKLTVTDDRGATAEAVKSITVQSDSFVEKLKDILPWHDASTITDDEFKIVKTGLNIRNHPYPYPQEDYWDPFSDMEANPDSKVNLYWYLDCDLRMALDKEIDAETPGLTYGVYMLNALNELRMVESVWNGDYRAKAMTFFTAMLGKNNSTWADAAGATNKTAKTALTSLLSQPYSFGVSTMLMSLDIAQAGVGINAYAKVRFYNSLHFYLDERARGTAHEEAWRSILMTGEGWAPQDDRLPTNDPTVLAEYQSYFRHIWDVYGDAVKKNSFAGFSHRLQIDFREALYSVLERHKPDLLSWQVIGAKSPIEIRVYDSAGNVTGAMSGEFIEQVSHSVYGDEMESVVILQPSGSYRYVVVGETTGTYGLNINSVAGGEVLAFAASDIPTAEGAVHQYTVDWDCLSQGGEGVTLQIDSDGDGEFERTVMSDSELTAEELTTEAGTRVHLWVYLVAAVGALVGLGALATLGVWLKRRLARPTP